MNIRRIWKIIRFALSAEYIEGGFKIVAPSEDETHSSNARALWQNYTAPTASSETPACPVGQCQGSDRPGHLKISAFATGVTQYFEGYLGPE